MKKLYLDWDLTNLCNLNCKYCLRGMKITTNEQKCTQVDQRTLLSVIEKILNLGVTRVILGGGEPLLEKNLVYIISELDKRGIQSWLTTNATLLDKKTSELLVENGLDILSVSIDSADPQKHDFLRGKGSFDLTIKGLEVFNTICEDEKYNDIPLIGISVTVTKDNINSESDIINMFDLALQTNVDEIQFNFALPVGRGTGYALKNDGEYRVRISEYIAKNSVLYPELLIRIGTGGSPLLTDYLKSKYTMKNMDISIMPCPAGEEMLYMSSELEIYPCSIICDSDFAGENILQYIPYNKKDQYYMNFTSLIDNTYFKTFKSIKERFSNEVYRPCRDCRYLAQCHSICRMHWMSRSREENLNTYIAPCIYLIEQKGIMFT
jgi:radical SAM protein with 4Fe4S-binding SPASM domain